MATERHVRARTSPLFLACAGCTIAGLVAAYLLFDWRAVCLLGAIAGIDALALLRQLRQLRSQQSQQSQQSQLAKPANRSRIDNEYHLGLLVRNLMVHQQSEQRLQLALKGEREAVFRLQELDRVKNDFVSSVSHELRSPLTSTLGYLELLAEGAGGKLNDEQSRMVEIAERNAKRLLGLIEDLLTLSHVESGMFNVRFKPLDIAFIVSSVTGRWTSAARERSINLSLEIGADLGDCVGDESQITRAIDSIVNNAVKFTPPDGRIAVNVARVGENMVLVVDDTGIGISAAEQPHLFTRFFRATEAIEQALPGTGLGLTLAKAIVEHHGGSVLVQSVLAKGTTVTMTLPALPLSANRPAVVGSPAVAGEITLA